MITSASIPSALPQRATSRATAFRLSDRLDRRSIRAACGDTVLVSCDRGADCSAAR